MSACRRPKDTKLSEVLTYHERFPPLKPQDPLTIWPTLGHVTTLKMFISTFTKNMAECSLQEDIQHANALVFTDVLFTGQLWSITFQKKNWNKNWVECEINRSRELSLLKYASTKEKENWRHPSYLDEWRSPVIARNNKIFQSKRSVYEGRLRKIKEKFENIQETYSLVFSTYISSDLLKPTRASCCSGLW